MNFQKIIIYAMCMTIFQSLMFTMHRFVARPKAAVPMLGMSTGMSNNTAQPVSLVQAKVSSEVIAQSMNIAQENQKPMRTETPHLTLVPELKELSEQVNAVAVLAQALKKSELGFDKNTKHENTKKQQWWNRGSTFKKIRDYFVTGIKTAALVPGFIVINEMQNWLDSSDVAVVDPELYDLFVVIKNDMEITENVNFRVMNPYFKTFQGHTANNVIAFYTAFCNVIFISPLYRRLKKSELIGLLAHELEHFRQYHQYSGSYAGGVSIKEECGADAAAADYQYCHACLWDVALQRWLANTAGFQPQDTEHGYFTTPLGYFAPEDFLLYQKRAKEDCALCKAHAIGTADDPNTPVKDFLPPKVA